MHPYLTRHCCRQLVENEKGFVLILAMVMLVVLSLLGLWAMTTATNEIIIAGNEQEYEKRFNIGEGGANVESGDIGFSQKDYYKISNPTKYNRLLYPTSAGSYDPSGDDFEERSGFAYSAGYQPDDGDETTWPRDNVLDDTNDDEFDYGYLVTYLYPDAPPKGYDATSFSGYKFRINGEQVIVIEQGGLKVGVKSVL